MEKAATLFKGFRFGMLLQIAIGPICLYVLKTALEYGVVNALAATCAATLADAIFVLLAILGVGAFLDRPRVKRFLKYFGAAVLAYYGAGIMLGNFGIRLIPGLGGILAVKTSSIFIYCFLLTASSPLTILFWTGVFASKLTGENYTRGRIYCFGAGAVLSTLLSLGAVALLSGLLQPVMTEEIINVLNIVVGAALLVFAARMALKKNKKGE